MPLLLPLIGLLIILENTKKPAELQSEISYKPQLTDLILPLAFLALSEWHSI